MAHVKCLLTTVPVDNLVPCPYNLLDFLCHFRPDRVGTLTSGVEAQKGDRHIWKGNWSAAARLNQ